MKTGPRVKIIVKIKRSTFMRHEYKVRRDFEKVTT